MNAKETNEQILEIAVHSEANQQKLLGFASRLGQVWSGFAESIFRVDEPKIHASKNKFGHVYWVTHNPFTGRRVYSHSETELRTWLDRRYYE